MVAPTTGRGGGAPPTPPPRLGSTFGADLPLFRGTFDHTLDAKNRLTVPARYRDEFEQGAVLAMPWDGRPCVWLWRAGEYDDFTSGALGALAPLSAERSELERFVYGKSQEVELDRAGRIMIPGFLAGHASLSKEVRVIGAGTRLELWSRERWESDSAGIDARIPEVISRLGGAA